MSRKCKLFSFMPIYLVVVCINNTCSLHLAFQAQWYLKFYAIIIYIALLAILIFIYRQFLINREKRRTYYQIKELETQRWKELDELKSSFFANISHEFRTPLTLIMSSLQKMMEEQLPGKNDLTVKLMYWNTNRLIFMINQILDLSKLDARKMKLSISKIKLEELLEPILLSFQTLTNSSEKVFDYEINDLETIVYCDVNKIERVVSNLLSNAFKYTDETGKISCRCRKVNYVPEDMAIRNVDEYIEFAVFDNGKGIPHEIQDKIFERFFTYHHTFESSTGIGLSLTKEFINLHGGNIKVESDPGVFTAFYMYLPLGVQHMDNYEMVPLSALNRRVDFSHIKHLEIIGEVIENEVDNSADQSILIVEDNAELQKILVALLKEKYKVLIAADGAKGIDMAIKYMPDLIISDIMMPHINGYELCKKLKNDILTSHIPIILLTAKVTNEDKIKGLSCGVNDYITKPFYNNEILLKVNNILSFQNKLKYKYTNFILRNDNNIDVSFDINDKLLLELKKVLEENYTDCNFNVDAFADILNISRVQLYRKVKSLTNQTTTEFIRNYRLEKAKELIKNKNFTVAQVAIQVGFSHPSYFTESFKKYFGTVPSNIENK